MAFSSKQFYELLQISVQLTGLAKHDCCLYNNKCTILFGM